MHGRARQYHPVVGVLIAVCLICTVLFIVGDSDTSQSIVHESMFKDSTSASAWLKRVKKVSAVNRVIKHAKRAKVNAVRISDKAAIKAEKLAALKQHQSNQLARKEMRREASKTAQSQVGKALAEMSANLRHIASHAAKKAAMAVVPKSKSKTSARVSAAGKRKSNASVKLRMLEKDVLLLTAAQKKAMQEFRNTRIKYMRKDQRYKALVNAKVLRARKDFLVMKRKLKSYKGAKQQERKVAAELRNLAHKVVASSQKLRQLRRRLKRSGVRLSTRLSRWALKTRRFHGLVTRTKQRYISIVKRLEAELARVRSKKDVNAIMASRIAAEQSLVAQQQQKLNQADQLIARLHKQIAQYKLRFRRNRVKAKKRKQVLRIAHVAYANLEKAVARLKAMAAVHGHTVIVKAPRASAAKTAERMRKNMVRTVERLAKRSRKKIAASVARAAAAAAAKTAHSNDRRGMRIHINGLNQAMAKGQATIAAVGKKPKFMKHHLHKPRHGPHPLKKLLKLVKKSRKENEYSRVKVAAIHEDHRNHAAAVRRAKQAKKQTFGGKTELLQHSTSRYRILSRVAHRLFSKAQKSGRSRDKLAAKVAMKRALAARRALEH